MCLGKLWPSLTVNEASAKSEKARNQVEAELVSCTQVQPEALRHTGRECNVISSLLTELSYDYYHYRTIQI